MSEWVMWQTVLPLLNFQFGPDYFLLKTDILGLAMLIWLDGDEGQVKFLQVT